jgi:hypothetical protein
MNTQFHDKIRRLAVLLAIATAFTALAAAPALGQDRPASSYYKPQDLQRMSDSWAARGGVLTNVPASSYYLPQDLQRMSDSWAARGGVLTNVPASSYYLPQQIETMSQGWAARGGPLPASAKVTTGRDGFDWGDFGIGAVAMLGLVLLGGGLVAGAHYIRRDVRAQPAA